MEQPHNQQVNNKKKKNKSTTKKKKEKNEDLDLDTSNMNELFNKLNTKVDIIHYHYPWPFADIVHSIIQPRVPTIVTYHSPLS